ncbi:MAG: molybdopterin-synthase adenylyltransferase MoeB [Chloroflexota bacterium]|nr:MAG: molybdopterin-synthase adenylyltransferase MoeB [Chloroflexota bacterium]
MFTEEQIRRYSRHILLPQVGAMGQKKLMNARVLLLGAGGLGSPAALYLAAAGVGTLGIVDFDTVDLSNLQRQILHRVDTVGLPKVESAARTIASINPDVKVVPFQQRLYSDNVFDVFRDFDIIVDGTDNFQTRYLTNDAAVMLDKTVVHGSIFQFDGQVTVFKPKDGPCYRCLFPSPPPAGAVPNCAEAGVFGVLPGIVGSIQAVEVLKLILGEGDPLIGRLLIFDAMAMEFSEVKIRRDPMCPMCGDSPTITELIDYDAFCGLPAYQPTDTVPVGAAV